MRFGVHRHMLRYAFFRYRRKRNGEMRPRCQENLCRRKAVARHIDHVVDTAQDINVTLVVNRSSVSSQVISRKTLEISRAESRFLIPQPDEAAGRKRQLNYHRAFSMWRKRSALII